MLKTEIEEAKRLVNTDTVQITIGEIASMYTAKELDIMPEFQRLFRWTNEKKSSFVESILIGIPIPPAFAFEQNDGTWELIDGLQRISTILEFMGILRDPENPQTTKHSVLTKTKYLPSIDGVSWAENGNPLDKSLQLFFRRARFDFQVLKHPSDPRTKFDLFQRLNRGGAYANEQEVRSCSMVLANREFTKTIKEIADSPQFLSVFRITDDQKLSQSNVEYAVRLIVHTVYDFDRGSDVQEFLDRSIVQILMDGDQKDIVDRIEWTVNTLHELKGDTALIPDDESVEGVAKRFSLRALEGIAVGIARNKQEICKTPDYKAFLEQKISQFWKQPDVAQMSASGLRGTTRIQRTVPFGAQWFRP